MLTGYSIKPTKAFTSSFELGKPKPPPRFHWRSSVKQESAL